jgi:hypothetical protein
MNTTHLAPEIRSEIATAIETVTHGRALNIRHGDHHWQIARCSDGSVIVFERQRGRRFHRWMDSDIRDLLTSR